MKYKIKQLAEELGLSRNTVAKVLNGKPGVSPKTEKLVLEKIRTLAAREEESDRDITVSAGDKGRGYILLLTKTSVNYTDFWISVMKGIESVLKESPYNLMLGIMDQHDIETLHLPSVLATGEIRGIILVEICDNRICDAVLQYGLPTATIDMPRDYQHILGRIDIVTMENKLHIREITEKLIQRGLTKFAFAGELAGNNVGRGFQDRYDALCETLKKHRLKLLKDSCFFDESDQLFLNSSYMLNKLRSLKEMPEVFICGNDWTAIQLINSLQFLGYRIPEDVSVVGFDNTEASAMVDPPLTTIHTPKEYLGRVVADCVLQRIRHPETPYVFATYMTDAIVRASTVPLT